MKTGEWQYKHESIVELRMKLGLNQTQMAKQLEIPINTLYRWETGATTPDAKFLASMYSLGMQQGITPSFFKRRRVVKNQDARNRIIAIWDFQNVGMTDYYVKTASDWLKEQLTRISPSINNRLLKVFAQPNQSAASDILSDQGWRVWEDETDLDDDIYDQARSDCLQDPQSNILVLITKDGDYKELIEEHQQKGVRVYLIGPWDTSRDIREIVGTKRFIEFPTNLSIQSFAQYWVTPPSSSRQ